MAFKRILTGLFICLCAFLLMSHNTYAAELQLPVRLRSVYNTTFSSTGSDHSFWGVQYGYGPMQSTMFRLNWSNLSCESGDYLETIVNFFNVTENNSLDSWVSSLYGGDSDFSFISATYENMDSSSGQIKFVIYCNTTFSNANKYLEFGSATGGKLHIYANEYITVIYTTRYSVVDPNAGTQDIVNAINNHPAPSAAEIGNAVNDSQEEATQDAADQSQSSGDQATADSQQATSSLLSTITGFFGALINADATNCKFNSGLPFLSGSGEIDLCSISTPPIIQVISSLILVGLFIPFAIHMFNRFIGITESFQR